MKKSRTIFENLKILNILLGFSILLFHIPAKSQPVSFTSIPLSIDRAFTNIVGMCQDDKGFIWLADNYNGLIKYDGSQFKSYKSNSHNPNSLSSDRLECLYAGSKGIIWIGTVQNGLDKFDTESETFTHYRHKKTNSFSLHIDQVSALLEDHQGTLWVGTANGLDTLDRLTGKFTHIEDNTKDGLALSKASIRVLYEDRSGIIWIGCGNPFLPKNVKYDGLYKFDKKSGKITRYQHQDNDENTLMDNRVRAIFEDSRGVFWVGTAGDGLHIMDREKETFQRCLYDPKNPQKLSRPPLNPHALYAVDHITFINEDMQGSIWIGTYASGINRYNPFTKTTEYYGTSTSGELKIDKNDFWCLLKTKDNLLWASGWEPANEHQVLYRISTLPSRFKYINIGKSVNAIAQDSLGLIWYGTNKGLVNNSTDSFFSAINNVIADKSVLKIQYDSMSNLWISTSNGLYCFTKDGKSFANFRHDPKKANSISSDWVFMTEQIGYGKLLIGTIRGLDELDISSGNFKHYNHDPLDSTSISDNRITDIKKDRFGNIWVGTLKGLNRFDQYTCKFSNNFNVSESRIFFIFEDSRGNVWIGPYRSGLYLYNQQSGDFVQFNDSTGIINNRILIRGMTEDKAHKLWLNTEIGFIRLDPASKNAVLFGKSCGINPKITTGNGFTSLDGEVFFKDTSGYYRFQAQVDEKEIGSGPQTYISKIYTDNIELSTEIDKILTRKMIQTNKIVLNHTQNNFAIEIDNIDFITLESEKNILYKMENYDNAWRKIISEKKAYYNNMQPGDYTFRVKASNCNGIWSEKSLAITVTPPWWNTWLFRISTVFILSGIMYNLIRWRLDEKFNRKLELASKEKKLSDLQQQKSELEMQVLRSQMNPHFIFNSLNSINLFILRNNKTIASEYLTKFSKLVRMILQNSQASLINLESELDALKLYLELEALRFNYHFTYNISLPKELDINVLKVPPLIIQPFVENAIWHGLMHKDEQGQLNIEISLENEHLSIRISDNGVGRKAGTAASKSTNINKSMGIKLTTDRITKMTGGNGTKPSVTIIDLEHPDGSAAGTEVLIKTPLIYD